MRGAAGVAERPTRLRSSPFAPQRVVAATRAPRLFYRRPRAFRLRAGGRGAGGGGERRGAEGAGLPPARRPSARRKGPSAPGRSRSGGAGESRLPERNGMWGRRTRARGGGRWCNRASASAPAAREPPTAPSPQLGSCSPAPPRPAEILCAPPSTLRPWEPGQDCSGGRAGPSPQSGWGCCAPRPERRPAPDGEITVRSSSSCPRSQATSGAADSSQTDAAGVWGQRRGMIVGAPGLRRW